MVAGAIEGDGVGVQRRGIEPSVGQIEISRDGDIQRNAGCAIGGIGGNDRRMGKRGALRSGDGAGRSRSCARWIGDRQQLPAFENFNDSTGRADNPRGSSGWVLHRQLAPKKLNPSRPKASALTSPT